MVLGPLAVPTTMYELRSSTLLATSEAPVMP